MAFRLRSMNNFDIDIMSAKITSDLSTCTRAELYILCIPHFSWGKDTLNFFWIELSLIHFNLLGMTCCPAICPIIPICGCIPGIIPGIIPISLHNTVLLLQNTYLYSYIMLWHYFCSHRPSARPPVRPSVRPPVRPPVLDWTSTFFLDAHWLCGAIEGEVESFSATLAQGGMAECDQSGKTL